MPHPLRPWRPKNRVTFNSMGRVAGHGPVVAATGIPADDPKAISDISVSGSHASLGISLAPWL
jgi:hypothetical protein